jgi:hypothetical protein
VAKDEKPDPKPAEIPWTPDQPLPDEEDEKETARVAQATARRRYLEDQHGATLADKGKKIDKDKKEKRKSIFG